MADDCAGMGLEELRLWNGEDNEDAVTRLDLLGFGRMGWEEYILRWIVHGLWRYLYRYQSQTPTICTDRLSLRKTQ